MDDPEAQLQAFIDRFDPAIGALARACRAKLRARFPTAVEVVYDNYNALAWGYAASEQRADIIVSLALYPRNVRLFFYFGARLADPTGRLEGSGNQVRSIQLTGPEVLDEPDVRALFDAAEADTRHPLGDEPGRTVIKSISARQRPRRPEPGNRTR